MRTTQFANHEYYHIYNRGVDKRTVFEEESDFFRFYISLILLNSEKDGLMEDWRDFKRCNPRAQLSEFLKQCSKSDNIVEIVAYCLNPNHYHLLLKQKTEGGIKKYMHKVATSYTNYFNVKHGRSGSLFQGRFKASHIKSTGKLLYMSVYVSCNSEVHGIAPAKNYPWCSFGEYISGSSKSNLCGGKKVVMDNFKRRDSFRDFVRENIQHMKERKEEEKLFLELSSRN
jgi:putative transposase